MSKVNLTKRFAEDNWQFSQARDLTADQGVSKNTFESFAAQYLPVLSYLFALYLPGSI